MLHKTRKWCVCDVESAEDLADKVTKSCWTMCTGFRYKGYLFLNDSTSSDGIAEYAVVKEDNLKQVESITFGWCNFEQALDYICRIVEGEFDEQAWESGITREQIQSPKEHKCHWCR